MNLIELKGNGQLIIKDDGTKELIVPHLDDDLTYILPLIGPSYHKKVMKQIDSQELLRPTTAHIISLIDLALQNPEEPNCGSILSRFRNNHLWTATETTSFSEGALIYDNIDGKMPSDSAGLIKLLDMGDRRVRFVPPVFPTRGMSISEFLKNPYTIAQVGEGTIDSLGRVASAFNEKKAYIFEDNKEDYDVKKLTAVYSRFYKIRFNLNGGCGEGGNGCVSGLAV